MHTQKILGKPGSEHAEAARVLLAFEDIERFRHEEETRKVDVEQLLLDVVVVREEQVEQVGAARHLGCVHHHRLEEESPQPQLLLVVVAAHETTKENLQKVSVNVVAGLKERLSTRRVE